MSDHTIGNGSATSNGHRSAGSALTTTPFPASRKVYVQGTQTGVRVPMREIGLTATKSMKGAHPLPMNRSRSTIPPAPIQTRTYRSTRGLDWRPIDETG